MDPMNERYRQRYSTPFFEWDTTQTSKKLQVLEDPLKVKAIDGTGFKSTLGNMDFLPGERYYFQISVVKGRLLKIGVSRRDVDLEEAFCNTEHGWAIYNGELRHNSTSSGKKYGEKLKAGDLIGVLVDMVDGRLSFSRNGEDWGVAYESPELAQGTLCPAVAMLYPEDEFALELTQPED